MRARRLGRYRVIAMRHKRTHRLSLWGWLIVSFDAVASCRTARTSGGSNGVLPFGMPVRKISVALDENTAQAASDAAARNGVSLSSWLNQAAERALRIEAGLRGVQAWEAENGALTPAELAAADRFLAKKQRKRAS
jgi:hypothetical protein